MRNLFQSHDRIPKMASEVTSEEGAFDLMREYDTVVKGAMDLDDDGDYYRRIFFNSFQPIINVLWNQTESGGWPFLERLYSTFNPDTDFTDSSPLVNVIGRMVILTRFRSGVNTIPVSALHFLNLFYDSEDDFEWDESFALGWGFDHQDIDFMDILLDSMTGNSAIWTSAILENAILADQEKGSEYLIKLLRMRDISPELKFELLQCVTFNENQLSTVLPRYWDWMEATKYQFTWIPEVKENIKKAIVEGFPELVEELPANWTFHDFEW